VSGPAEVEVVQLMHHFTQCEPRKAETAPFWCSTPAFRGARCRGGARDAPLRLPRAGSPPLLRVGASRHGRQARGQEHGSCPGGASGSSTRPTTAATVLHQCRRVTDCQRLGREQWSFLRCRRETKRQGGGRRNASASEMPCGGITRTAAEEKPSCLGAGEPAPLAVSVGDGSCLRASVLHRATHRALGTARGVSEPRSRPARGTRPCSRERRPSSPTSRRGPRARTSTACPRCGT
jgi:hypothetical protein